MKPKADKWWDVAWNPVTGCSPCSPGCDHCWAAAMSKRYNRSWNVTMHLDRMDHPLRWKKPRTVFVCNMADLWHNQVPLSYRAKVISRATDFPQHTFVFLTKRPAKLLTELAIWTAKPSNLYFGATICNQEEADQKIKYMLALNGLQRWLCIEPMLGPIDISGYLGMLVPNGAGGFAVFNDDGSFPKSLCGVILGAETGPGKRRMELDWARRVRNQCSAAGVPFFFKKDSEGNHELDGITCDATPWPASRNKS